MAWPCHVILFIVSEFVFERTESAVLCFDNQLRHHPRVHNKICVAASHFLREHTLGTADYLESLSMAGLRVISHAHVFALNAIMEVDLLAHRGPIGHRSLQRPFGLGIGVYSPCGFSFRNPSYQPLVKRLPRTWITMYVALFENVAFIAVSFLGNISDAKVERLKGAS